MRKGWKKGRLGDFFEIVTGSTPPKSNPIMFGGYMPLVKPPELTGGRISRAEDSLSKEGVAVSRVLPAGSILVSCIGNLGKFGLAAVELVSNQQINAIKPSPEMALPEFVYFLVQSPGFIRQLQGLASGTTVPIVNKSKFQSILVSLPSLAEQKRIVAILDEAFEGIDTAIANTEKNLANARELYESRLSAIFGRKNEGWRDLTLREVCKDYGRGKSKHRPRNDSKLYVGKYPFIQTGDVRNSDHLIKEYTVTYNEVGLAQSKLWPKGTICITIAANIAETGILNFDACFPDSIIGLVVDETMTSNYYVEFLLQSVKSVLKAKGKGSAQDNINLATFANEKFPFPALDVQLKIVEELQELRSSIRELEFIYQQKLTALTELKQSLLQKAFSGELTANATTSNTIVEEAAFA